MSTIRLSPTKLALYRECARCFWEAGHEMARPYTPVASITDGLDREIKKWLDQYPGALPPALVGTVPGTLHPDRQWVARLRHWRSGLTATVESPAGPVTLIGALDDVLVTPNGVCALDVKTKGSAPKSGDEHWHRDQLDCYALLLAQAGLPVSPEAVLLYVYPQGVETPGVKDEPDFTCRFGFQAVRVLADSHAAEVLVQEAAQVLAEPTPPPPSLSCKWCAWAEARLRPLGEVAQ